MRVLFCESLLMWSWTLPQGFKALGHRTAFSGVVRQGHLRETFEQFRPDLVVTMGWGEEHTPEKIRLVREAVEAYGVPHVYWAIEDPNYFEAWSLPYVRQARPHLVLTICSEMVRRYREHGFQAEHLEFACNPVLHRTIATRPQYACDVALVGNSYFHMAKTFSPQIEFRYHTVELLLKPLLRHGCSLSIWGTDWRQLAKELGLALPEGAVRGPLPYEETPAVFNSATIVLGLQNSPLHLTQRTYEVLGSGGFLLTVRTKAVSRVFFPGRHLMVTSNARETVELVDHYLSHPEQRVLLARKGQEDVHQHHTYGHRVSRLLKLLDSCHPLSRHRDGLRRPGDG